MYIHYSYLPNPRPLRVPMSHLSLLSKSRSRRHRARIEIPAFWVETSKFLRRMYRDINVYMRKKASKGEAFVARLSALENTQRRP